MKIIYTKHTEEKFLALRKEGWFITKRKIREVIENPKWIGGTRYNQETVIGLLDERHILRVVLDRTGDIIRVITFHIGKRGRYEGAL
ncbi:MAG: hypothetical protein Q7R82_01585 [Candidatus Daviesbacteria bacterium]|nr:hypothetical protein [Candidatus Daviesbacteria bacterium]